MEPIKNSETFAKFLNSLSSGLITDDNVWKLFGYKKCPKRGLKFEKFMNKDKLKVEKYLLRELYLVCVVNGIYSLDVTNELKYKILLRVLEMLLLTQGVVEAFGFSSDIEAYNYLFNNSKEYFTSKRDDYTAIFTKHSRKFLGSSFKSGWIVGFIYLHNSPGCILSNMVTYLNDRVNTQLSDDIDFESQYIEDEYMSLFP